MAFAAQFNLARTPDAYMNAAASSLRANWSSWRPRQPLTPPMTSTFQSRTPPPPPVADKLATTTTLPPIAHLERHLPPLTPPEDIPLSRIPMAVEPPTPFTSAAAATTITTLALAPAPPAYLVDWLDFTRTRSAHFIAEKTCEMICYLWFSIKDTTTPPTTLQLVATPTFVSFMQKLLETTQVSQSVIVLSLHYIHRLKEKNQYMPAQPGSEFRIAVAGLMMANKFLDDNTYTNKTWSEVSGITLGEINRMEREFLLGVDFNLYVDKPTYASWLNLLKGLVMAKERDARRLLKGGRGAAGRRAAGGRERERRDREHHQQYTAGPASRTYTTPAAAANASSRQKPAYRHRARSTSPQTTSATTSTNRTVSHSHHVAPAYPYPPQPQPCSTTTTTAYTYPSSQIIDLTSPSPTPPARTTKRSAQDAFSPLASSGKRPTSGLQSLQIPEYRSGSTGTSTANGSPLDGLHGFVERMSLGVEEEERERERERERGRERDDREREREQRASKRVKADDSSLATTVTSDAVPRTLVAAYEVKGNVVPKNLFFYTLACSPNADEKQREREMRTQREASSSTSASASASASTATTPYYESTESRARKARLRYQAAQPVSYHSNSQHTHRGGYDYADMNAFTASARGAPLYSTGSGYIPERPATMISTLTSAPAQENTDTDTDTDIVVDNTAGMPTPPLVPARYVAYTYPVQQQQQQGYTHTHTHTHTHAQQQGQHHALAQSATTSPVMVYGSTTAAVGAVSMPHFRDDVWARPPAPAVPVPVAAQSQSQSQSQDRWYQGQYAHAKDPRALEDDDQTMAYTDSPVMHSSTVAPVPAPAPAVTPSATSSPYQSSPYQSSPYQSSPYDYPQHTQHHPHRSSHPHIPSAPFANAGPPGVKAPFYHTPEVQMQAPVGVHGHGSVHGGVQGCVQGDTQAVYAQVYASQSGTGGYVSQQSHHHHHHQQQQQTTTTSSGTTGSGYTYSGAHSTSNSPYHSASYASYYAAPSYGRSSGY